MRYLGYAVRLGSLRVCLAAIGKPGHQIVLVKLLRLMSFSKVEFTVRFFALELYLFDKVQSRPLTSDL